MDHFQKMDEYGGNDVYCSCGVRLGYRYGNGEFLPSSFMNSRIVHGQRLCRKCADDRENMEEMGYTGCKEVPRPVMMDKSDEEARRMSRLEKLPIVRHDEKTFLSDLGRARVLDPLLTVEVIMTHEIASKDVNGWLDTLNNPEATEAEREHALERLRFTSEEYRWLCAKRAQIEEKVQTFVDDNSITVTWRTS